MNLFEYWAKESITIRAKNKKPFEKFFYQGSSISEENAKIILADTIKKRAEEFENKIQTQSKPPLSLREKIWGQKKHTNHASGAKNSDSKDYATIDMVEPVLSWIQKGPNINAAITRNRYGAEVLCVDKVFIADIDFATSSIFSKKPYIPVDWKDQILTLFGVETARYKNAVESQIAFTTLLSQVEKKYCLRHEKEAIALIHIKKIQAQYPNLCFWIYQTCAGLRVFETSQLHDPQDKKTEQLLKELGTDQAYSLMCKKQNCFRARVSPKPWRCGWSRPTVFYPFGSEEEKASFNDWLSSYEEHAKRKAVCRHLATTSAQIPSPEIEVVLKAHEKKTINAVLNLG